MDGNNFKGEFIQVKSTDPYAPDSGNYVIFRHLSADLFSLRIDDDELLIDGLNNRPTIAGLQIVGGPDKNDVVIAGDWDADAVIGDNGMARFVNGQLIEISSTDSVVVNDDERFQADEISTGDGKDVVIAGNDHDSIQGGAGDDLLLGDHARVLYADGEVIGLNPPSNDRRPSEFDPDNVEGIELLDHTIGGDDHIEGGKDNDIQYGQYGNDTYEFVGGGLGRDRLVEEGESIPARGEHGSTESQNPLNDQRDRLDFSQFMGPVTLDLENSNVQNINHEFFQNDINLTLQFYPSSGFEDVTGSEFDDQISGNHRSNMISGQDGDDEVSGLSGDDILGGNDGNDTVLGGSGNDIIDGGDGADQLAGDGGGHAHIDDGKDDIILGGNGDDQIQGSDGNDIIDGEAGADLIKGNNGDDLLVGGTGNDTIDGGAGIDQLEGGEGTDTIQRQSIDALVEQDTSSEALGLRQRFADFSLEVTHDDFFFEDPNPTDPIPTQDRPVRRWLRTFLSLLPGFDQENLL